LSEKTENSVSWNPTGKLIPDLYKLQDQVRHGEVDWVGRGCRRNKKSHGEAVSYDSNASYEASRRLDTSTSTDSKYHKYQNKELFLLNLGLILPSQIASKSNNLFSFYSIYSSWNKF
jgi:hypothetical protein